jgi:hypothetical protein
MVKFIPKRGNLSAPGLDGITFLKFEKESAARLLMAMIRFTIFHKKVRKFG